MGAEGHFFWGSVMYGYLLYDTAFTLAFYRAIGSPSFLAHHALGLLCCWLGLYYNRCASTQVASTNHTVLHPHSGLQLGPAIAERPAP